jgi:hypothetical protein
LRPNPFGLGASPSHTPHVAARQHRSCRTSRHTHRRARPTQGWVGGHRPRRPATAARDDADTQTAAVEPAKGTTSPTPVPRRGGSPPLNMQWPSPLRNARGRPRPGRGDKTSVSLTVHRSRNWHVRYSSRSQSPQASDHADGGVGEFRVFILTEATTQKHTSRNRRWAWTQNINPLGMDSLHTRNFTALCFVFRDGVAKGEELSSLRSGSRVCPVRRVEICRGPA